jgi:hypothetical protein
MKTRPLLAGLAFAVAIIGTTFQAQAAVSIAYSNGATNGAGLSQAINAGVSVSNSFTLVDSEELNGAIVGIWTDPGDYLTSVDWAITDTAFGSVLASGTASSITKTFFGTASGFDVNDASFAISSPTLAAGTYYFQLSNAVTANTILVYWDNSSGPSIADQSTDGGATSFRLVHSQAFTLTAVPEASSACLGLLGAMGLLVRRRRVA